jgi:two-component system nitrate/nitrite response regulator NarL
MTEKVHVVVVDDHPLFRDGVANILAGEADMEVVGQGSSAEEAVRLARDLLPDLMLLDIDMPGNGLDAARRIGEAYPVIRIVLLTVSEAEENLLGAMKAGAKAYILKGVAGRELLRIVRLVLSGESYVPPALAASLLMELGKPAGQKRAAADARDELTQREVEILELLAKGMSNREIGEKLFLTEKTVKHYVTNILQKLQVHNRVEAALLAQKSRWFENE